MKTRLNPYLAFQDNTREAMQFYQGVFGGKLTLGTFKEFGMPTDPGEENKIMHSMLEADNGITLMAADTPKHWEYRTGTNMSISLSGEEEKVLRSYWEKLAKGASILQPLAKAPWGDTFGMLTDRFGVNWLVNIAAPKG